MKYTIIYERTVRVREYETLKMGIWRECDNTIIDEHTAFDTLAFLVDTELEDNLERLRDAP